MGSTASLDRSPRKNWVENSGSLPSYVREVARSIERKRGVPLSQAVALAIGAMKRWSAGAGDVNADTRAKARRAVAEWEALRAKNKARQVQTAHHVRTADTVDLANDGSVLLSHATHDGLMVLSSVTGGRVIELARYVRTEAGAKRYGRPIGTMIERGGKRSAGTSGDRGGSRSGGRAGGSSPRRSGSASGAKPRTDGQGKALPKGQRTGGDYVREGLARRQAAEERKRAKYEAQRDGQLRAKQKEIARAWLAAKAAGTPATDRKQRERRAEVNALQAEITRRGQNRPQAAVGANATHADRLARMGEMERRAALRDMPDGDLKSARSELSARETSGKPSATKAAINAELARREGGKPAASPSPASVPDSIRQFQEAAARSENPLGKPRPKTGDKPLTERTDRELDGMQRRARDAVRKGDGGAETGRDQATASAVSDERNRRRQPADEDLAAERKKVNRVFSRYSSEQRANNAASHRQGPRQRQAVGDYYYTHPDVPNRAFDSRDQAARAGLKANAAGAPVDLDKSPQAASTADKPAGDGPALSDRLRKLTDGQLAAMDDALSKKGGEPSERHKAIRAERARRGGTLTAPGELRIQNEPRARRWTNVPGGGRVWSPAPGETGRKTKKPGKLAPTRTPALDRFGRPAKPRPAGGPLDKPGGMDAAKRAPAAPDPQARSANPTRDAAPGAVAAPPKAPAGKDPGESARPGSGQSATPKAPGTATAATDPPAKMPNTAAPKRATGVTGGQAGPDAPRGRRADGTPRTQGDDEDDALFEQSKARNEARRARGEKLPDPYADDQPTPAPARPARASDAPAGNRLQDYARADAAERQQMVGQLSDAELNQLDGALGRAAERAPDDTVRSVLAGRRGEIDRERMRRRTAGMTDRPAAGSQDRQTPGGGAPKVSTRDLLERTAAERRAAPAAIDAPRASAPVAPPQATSRPAPVGSPRAPGRIPDNRGTRTYNMPDRPITGDPAPTPPPAPAPDGDGIGGAPNLSRLEQLDDEQLRAAVQRAGQRLERAKNADPRRQGLPFADAQTAYRTLMDEQRRRQSAPAAAPDAGRFNPALLTPGQRVQVRGDIANPAGEAEVVSGNARGYIVRGADGRERQVLTDDVLGPAGPSVPEQRGPDVPFGPQNAAPPAPRTGSGTRRLNGAQIRALQAQLIRETDPERKAALRARIAAGQGRGAVTRQMSQARAGREVELAMGGTKGRGMADMSDEQLDKAEKRAAALARGRTGPAAARAARVMVAARGEKRRRKGSGASSAKSNRPPAFVKALSQPVELAQATPRGTRVTTTERAAQIVGGTALGEHRYPRGA